MHKTINQNILGHMDKVPERNSPCLFRGWCFFTSECVTTDVRIRLKSDVANDVFVPAKLEERQDVVDFYKQGRNAEVGPLTVSSLCGWSVELSDLSNINKVEYQMLLPNCSHLPNSSHDELNWVVFGGWNLSDMDDTLLFDANEINLPFKIFIYKKSDFISNTLSKLQPWEKHIMDEINKIPSGGSFLDIGANIGWHTLYAASRGIKVTAFEPMTDNIEMLKKSIEINHFNDLVKLYPVRLSDINHKMSIVAYASNKGNGRVLSDKLKQKTGNRSTDCTFLRLDDIDMDQKIFNLIKMDIEGHESNCVRGGYEFFARNQCTPVIYEYSPDSVEQYGNDKYLALTMMNRETAYILQTRETINLNSLDEIISLANRNVQYDIRFNPNKKSK